MTSTEQYEQDSSTPTQPIPTPWHVAVEGMVAARIADAFDGLDAEVERLIGEKLPEVIDSEEVAELIDAETIADGMFSGWEGDRRFRRLVSMVSEDITAEEIAEALGFDAEDIAQALDCDAVAERIDCATVAQHLDYAEVAGHIEVDGDDIAERIGDSIGAQDVAGWVAVEEVAGYLDLGEIAERVDLEGLARYLTDEAGTDSLRAQVENLAEAHVAERDALRAEVEALRERVEMLDGALAHVVGCLAGFALPFVQSIEKAQALAEQMTAEADAETTTGTEAGGLYL